MYRRDAFAEDRREVLLAAIRDIGLAALVTPTDGEIMATHAPVVVRVDGDRLFLDTHVARGNPQWRAAKIEDGAASLALFQGPQAYVSPSFYPSKAAHGKVVPTWAYIAVHAHGRLTAVQDPHWLRAHLEALTDAHEATRETPWRVDDAPETFLAGLTRGIVGLSLAVDRLEGAWKINQHKGEADRAGTAAGLAASGPEGAALAAALLMEEADGGARRP